MLAFRRTFDVSNIVGISDYLDNLKVVHEINPLARYNDPFVEISFNSEEDMKSATLYEFANYVRSMPNNEERREAFCRCAEQLNLDGEAIKNFASRCDYMLLSPVK